MSRYGVLLKWISGVLLVLGIISIHIDSKSSLNEELGAYKNMKENYNQSQEQNETTASEEDYNSETDISSQKPSVPLTHTFARIFGSFWIIILAIGLGITGRILAPRKLQ